MAKSNLIDQIRIDWRVGSSELIDIYSVIPTLGASWIDPVTGTETRKIPDFRNAGSTFDVSNDNVIDIVVLGDGFQSADGGDFLAYAEAFYDSLFSIWPYRIFEQAFRVSAVFTPSVERCGTTSPSASNTFYRIPVCNLDADGNPIPGSDFVKPGSASDYFYEEVLHKIIFEVSDLVGLNMRKYPEHLRTDWSSTWPQQVSNPPKEHNDVRCALGRSTYQNLGRNLVIVQGVNCAGGHRPSGYAANVAAPANSVSWPMSVKVGFGEYNIHEFGHSFALLQDEYIRQKDKFTNKLRFDPGIPSIFTLANISFGNHGRKSLWRHLSYDGLDPRPHTPSSPSWVGQQWIGGKAVENGVWHSEYMCLMNGRTAFLYRTDESTPATVPNLRTRDRLCLWCEEIVTLRILEKTSALFRSGDPEENFNNLGRVWYWRWVDDLRANYWVEFDLPTRIQARELWYQNPAHLLTTAWDGNLVGTDLMTDIAERSSGCCRNLNLL